MKKMNIDEQWGYLVEYGYTTDDTLKVITSINGYNQETINSVIYAVTGYHDIDQLTENE